MDPHPWDAALREYIQSKMDWQQICLLHRWLAWLPLLLVLTLCYAPCASGGQIPAAQIQGMCGIFHCVAQSTLLHDPFSIFLCYHAHTHKWCIWYVCTSITSRCCRVYMYVHSKLIHFLHLFYIVLSSLDVVVKYLSICNMHTYTILTLYALYISSSWRILYCDERRRMDE